MDSRRFDTWSRAFAHRHSRRAAVRGTGTGLAALLAGFAGRRGATAQEATPDPAGSHPTFLFVQTATSGGFRPNPGEGTPEVEGTPTPGGGAEYLLTLEGHHGATIYFSDRPDRVFGDTPTQQFLDGLGFSPANPPNAALVTQADDDADDEVIIVELVNPTFDADAGTVTYGANILGEYAGEPLTAVAPDQTAGMLPETFARASLFIDECQPVTKCVLGFLVPGFIAAIPGGPYQRCWDPSTGTCQPCDMTYDQLKAICNDAFPEGCVNACNPI